MFNIDNYLPKIKEICTAYRIKRLFIFGSALSNNFSKDSDIDLLVEFNRTGIKGSFDQYFNFKEAMEEVLGRKIDLVCRNSISNPIFSEEIESSKKELYGT
jgi:predicted nucleotidyltransferase